MILIAIPVINYAILVLDLKLANVIVVNLNLN